MSTSGRRPADREAAQVITSLWRGVVVLRVVTAVFAIIVFVVHRDSYARPGLGWAIVAVLVVWTVVVTACYSRDQGRRLAVVIADLLLTLALMVGSTLVLTPAQLVEPFPLVTTVWATGPIVAAAVLTGRFGGLLTSALVATTNIVVRGHFDIDIARDTVLALCLGFVLGLSSDSARRTEARLRAALRTEAANSERERLARDIHDGVLQVLAHVRRRGAELGGEAGRLAELAGEQEVALRALVSAAPRNLGEPGESRGLGEPLEVGRSRGRRRRRDLVAGRADDQVDLGAVLGLMATSRVHVSTPAGPVPLAAQVAGALAAVAGEALANVSRHAGVGADAWVLLEDLGDRVIVTVRDNGCGIADGRLAAAAAEGRLGIARSMRGRVHDLGGTIDLQTASGEGTEWEIRIPRSRS